MNHTFLNKKYRGYIIFRIMDEITCCIKSIKDYLKKEGFDENKLELAIGEVLQVPIYHYYMDIQ